METQQPPVGVEILGKVKRVLRRKLGEADRRDIDASVHALLDARSGVERQHKRAAKAAAKLKERLVQLNANLDELHRRWKEPEVEAITLLRVERTSVEIRLVREDNGHIFFRRPLNRSETEALGATLPHMPDRPVVRHPELEPDAEATKLEEREQEAKATRDSLAKPFTLEDAFAAIDREAEGDDEEPPNDAPPPDPTPKAKRPRKGKRAVNQPDLPMKDKT